MAEHSGNERSKRDPAVDELLDLVWSLGEGRLDAEGSARLDAMLLADARNRELYRDFMQVAAWLEYEQPVDGGCWSSSAIVEGVAALPGLEDEVRRAEEFPERGEVRRCDARWCLAAAVCASVAAVAIGFGLRYYTERPGAMVAEAEPETVEPARDVISVRFSTAESRKLPISDVGSISIQGPAHVELFGATHARLYQGRVRVRIDDERGHGFYVETPRGKVIDLGTEFGVDVGQGADTGVVVFEGAVDVSVGSEQDESLRRVERLYQGEGLSVLEAGRLDRIMSVVTGKGITFQQSGERGLDGSMPTIVDVSDNIRSSDFKKFYEIVPEGMREDALTYADRPQHEWNGVDERGLPPYLVGADYVKPFNSDKMRKDVELRVTLARPARLFVLLDDRVTPPVWLRESFVDTGDDVGLDCGPFKMDGVDHYFPPGKGAGQSVEVTFSVWEREIGEAGVVWLGPNSGSTYDTGMYGVAATPLEEPVVFARRGVRFRSPIVRE